MYEHDLWQRSRNVLDLQYSHTFINSIRRLLLPTFRSLATIVSETSFVFSFYNGNTQITKFDLAVKYVKVNPGSLFEQTMIGWSHRCYIPSFVEIGLPEKIFEGFLPYMGMEAILVMSHRCREHSFVTPTHGGSTDNLALIGQGVLEKKMFENVDRR